MVAFARLPVRRGDVRVRGDERGPRDDAVGARERRAVERVYVRYGGAGWAPERAAVGARQPRVVGYVQAYIRGAGEIAFDMRGEAR